MRFFKESVTTIISILILCSYVYLRIGKFDLQELDYLLIGAFMGIIPFLLAFGWGSRVKKIFGNPKLELVPKIEIEHFKYKQEDKHESKKITFWIHARNLGNENAENCKIRLKITDGSGRKKVVQETTHPNIDEDIPISWLIAGEKYEARDISPSKYFDSMFKIPFVIESIPDDEDDDEESIIIDRPLGKIYFEDPIKKSFSFSMFTLVGERNVELGLLIEVIITSNIGNILQKKFRIKLDENITFTPIE